MFNRGALREKSERSCLPEARKSNIEVGIMANITPLGSFCNYTIIILKNPILLQAPT